jgi:hypothetical protein
MSDYRRLKKASIARLDSFKRSRSYHYRSHIPEHLKALFASNGNGTIYDLSNIDDLVFSIDEVGLLTPLVVNQQCQLILRLALSSIIKFSGDIVDRWAEDKRGSGEST